MSDSSCQTVIDSCFESLGLSHIKYETPKGKPYWVDTPNTPKWVQLKRLFRSMDKNSALVNWMWTNMIMDESIESLYHSSHTTNLEKS